MFQGHWHGHIRHSTVNYSYNKMISCRGAQRWQTKSDWTSSKSQCLTVWPTLTSSTNSYISTYNPSSTATLKWLATGHSCMYCSMLTIVRLASWSSLSLEAESSTWWKGPQRSEVHTMWLEVRALTAEMMNVRQKNKTQQVCSSAGAAEDVEDGECEPSHGTSAFCSPPITVGPLFHDHYLQSRVIMLRK